MWCSIWREERGWNQLSSLYTLFSVFFFLIFILLYLVLRLVSSLFKSYTALKAIFTLESKGFHPSIPIVFFFFLLFLYFFFLLLLNSFVFRGIPILSCTISSRKVKVYRKTKFKLWIVFFCVAFFFLLWNTVQTVCPKRFVMTEKKNGSWHNSIE